MLGTSSILGLSPLVFLGAAGLAVLLYGIRGRREGDVPHCRKCDYNLTGLTSERCPECGSSVFPAGIIYGAYRRRWLPVIVSVLPLLVSALMLGNLTYQHARMFNPYRYYPFGWLLSDAQRGKALAFYELLRRERDRELSEVQFGELVEAGLKVQAQEPPPSSIGMWLRTLNRWDKSDVLTPDQRTRFIEAVLVRKDKSSTPIYRVTWLDFELLSGWDVNGLLSANQRTRFYRQLEALVIPTIRQPLKTRSEGPLTITLTHHELAISVWRMNFAFSVAGQPLAVIPDHPVPDTPSGYPHAHEVPVVHLPQGQHQLEYRARYDFFRPGHPRWQRLRPGENSYGWDYSGAFLSKEIVVTAELEVLPPFDPARIKLINDPAMTELIRQAIALQPIWADQATRNTRSALRVPRLLKQAIGLEPIWSPRSTQVPTEIIVAIDFALLRSLPIHVACDVLLRLPDRDVYVGTVAWPKSAETNYPSSRGLEVAVPRLEARHAFVVLRANPEAARPFAEIDRIWDGELVLGPEYIWWRER